MRFDSRLTKLEQRTAATHRGGPVFQRLGDGLFCDISRLAFDHSLTGLEPPPFVRRYTLAEVQAMGQGGA